MEQELWPVIIDQLAACGWTARVAPVERLAEVSARVDATLGSDALPEDAAGHLREETTFVIPASAPEPRSVLIAATPRPLTRATITVDGGERIVPVPPHYAGYYTLPVELEVALRDALAPSGFTAALVAPPLKTLAVASGLARFGRNNIAYVPGLGSYLLLAACVTDAPPPEDAPWGDARQLERCSGCRACQRACPTGAVADDRFLLHTERCLTFMNESEAPFPAWVDPAWHTCAVGCVRCQQACPENAGLALRVDDAVRFDEAETAALLRGDRDGWTEDGRERLRRCGLDYSPSLIARNLRALLGLEL